ncbi:MAG: ATP-dependent helicase HrpB, partial [Gemmatimonadota bacterium]|nr:ATP-dependent helicase HrpB [Gemmatimonadota bacterium]
RVPLALLEASWLGGNRILMLEPRRLATRAAARRMSDTLGESVGTTVGYRVRGETRVGHSTRIEVITEGVLTRMLLDDPALDSVGAVLFDEFHERSLNADFGLALALQGQSLLRPDLRILVMSATLDGNAVAALLGAAPIVTSVGRVHPVVVRYHPCRAALRIEACVAQVVRMALDNDDGGVLAFLPGAGEIRRCLALLERADLGGNVRLLPLFGDLAVERQDAAIAPAPPGVRKVVLATSIAETSLTIDGIRVVVDSGVARVSKFSPRTGMARLETIRASRSSVDQRSGRAGRTAAGVSYRLWSEYEQSHLPDRGRAEILDADLAPLALDLAATGIRDPADLRWLDAPPVPALAHARTLLQQLDALDGEFQITPHGRAMARLGLHPRLSHMVLVAQERGMGATACIVAALLEERDILSREAATRDRDLRTRVAIVMERSVASEVDRDALRRVRDQSRALRQVNGIGRDDQADPAFTGADLALAYPERVAQRRAGSVDRYLMRNGMGVLLEDAGSLGGADYLVAADLDGRVPYARVYLATAVDRGDVESLFLRDVVVSDDVVWDADTGTVTAVRRERLGAIVLREAVVSDPDAEQVMDVVTMAIVHGDGVGLPWSRDARDFVERVAFLRSHGHLLPDMSESVLLHSAQVWLRPHLLGVRRRSQVDRVDLLALLEQMLTWDQRRDLDALAPSHVTVPTGSRIRVDYSDAASPTIAVRLQELFGLADTPRIGPVAITLQLLSPANRPVQVTRDLAGFWRSSYFDVRKDLRGRYPKHEWPDDPLRAAPTRRAKPRT